MWITLYTDASFKQLTTGYGLWIKSSQQRIIKSGISRKPTCSTSAEMFAAWQGIKLVIKTHPHISGILLNSDNQYVVNSLNFKNHSIPCKNLLIESFRQEIFKLLKKYNFKIRTKHVKGHQKSTNTKFYLNNQVDKLSKVK